MLKPPLGSRHSGHLGGACTLAEYLEHRCTLRDFPKIEGNLTLPKRNTQMKNQFSTGNKLL